MILNKKKLHHLCGMYHLLEHSKYCNFKFWVRNVKCPRLGTKCPGTNCPGTKCPGTKCPTPVLCMSYTLLSHNSHIYSLYDELLDLKNSYNYEKYLMSIVCKRKLCIQRTPFFQILCLQSPPQNDSKMSFMFENNNSGNLM